MDARAARAPDGGAAGGGGRRDRLGGDGRAHQPACKLRSVQTAPRAAEPKTLRVVHRTVYRYTQQVERSRHVIKLVPVQDRVQSLLEHAIVLTLDGEAHEGKRIDFDDVFGNRARLVVIERPYRELVIEAASKVKLEAPPLDFKPLDARRVIPLVWMPWQREMMAPYLLPAELPETQLQELADYARAFVERNDNDLIGTVLDMTRSIYKQYKYLQGSTTLGTTAFDVYANRRGVCQDFTNLLICLARLLSIPARYTCGYLYTGATAENTAQSEASHAWVELYLPEYGWQGFDPTNGVVTADGSRARRGEPQLPRCDADVGHAVRRGRGGDAARRGARRRGVGRREGVGGDRSRRGGSRSRVAKGRVAVAVEGREEGGSRSRVAVAVAVAGSRLEGRTSPVTATSAPRYARVTQVAIGLGGLGWGWGVHLA